MGVGDKSWGVAGVLENGDDAGVQSLQYVVSIHNDGVSTRLLVTG